MKTARAEGEVLKLLARPGVSEEEFEQIAADPSARRFHSVRLALAAHRRTPRSEALTLVTTLYWRGLARLSGDARVHPEIRRAADRDLCRRLTEMALAERVDLARTAGRGTLAALRADPDPRVLSATLDNRFTTEPDIVQMASRRDAAPAILEIIASHPRWGASSEVRGALLRNPALPLAVGLALLTRARARDLAGLRDSPGVPGLLKACAERVLARRAPTP